MATTSIPAFHVSDPTKVEGGGEVFISSRTGGAAGVFAVKVAVHFDPAADDYPGGSMHDQGRPERLAQGDLHRHLGRAGRLVRQAQPDRLPDRPLQGRRPCRRRAAEGAALLADGGRQPVGIDHRAGHARRGRLRHPRPHRRPHRLRHRPAAQRRHHGDAEVASSSSSRRRRRHAGTRRDPADRLAGDPARNRPGRQAAPRPPDGVLQRLPMPAGRVPPAPGPMSPRVLSSAGGPKPGDGVAFRRAALRAVSRRPSASSPPPARAPAGPRRAPAPRRWRRASARRPR